MKPNKPLLRKWVAALRSGAYHQTDGVLCRVDNRQTTHCCLGVVCRVAAKNGLDIKTDSGDDWGRVVTFGYKNIFDHKELPRSLRLELGISKRMQRRLVFMNDEGRPFREIADFIEKHYKL